MNLMNLFHLVQNAPRLPGFPALANMPWTGQGHAGAGFAPAGRPSPFEAPRASPFGHAVAQAAPTPGAAHHLANWMGQAPNNGRIDWGLQLTRLAAALQDADPAGQPGNLTALDQHNALQQEQRRKEALDRERRNAFVDTAGMSEAERRLYDLSPDYWLRIFGPHFMGRLGGATRTPFPDDED